MLQFDPRKLLPHHHLRSSALLSAKPGSNVTRGIPASPL